MKTTGDTFGKGHYSYTLPIFPVFSSLFSMTTGGLAWFTDLTVADPYYVLPVIMATSLFIQFKFSVDGMGTQQMSPLMKKAIFVIPPVMFLFMKNFPAVSKI